MSGTDIELRAPHYVERHATFLPPQDEYQRMMWAADHLSATDFVPKALRGKKEAVLAAMLTGREMGIGPMRALRQINVIDGKPSPEPELLMARVLDRGHYIRVAATSRDRCVVRARRKEWADDEPTFELEWTIDDAVAADLVEIRQGKPYARSSNGKKLPWETYTRAMLRSRAVGEVCRAVFPDITEGASYAPEELTQGVVFDPNGGGEVLDGLSDELREQVERGIDPAAPVRALADEGIRDGWLSAGERDTLVVYAEKHPEHPPRAIERLQQLRTERDGGGPEDGEVVDGEVVDVRERPAEQTRALTAAEQAMLDKWKIDGETLSQLALAATRGRTAATTALTDDEAHAVMVLGRAWERGAVELGQVVDGVPTLSVPLEEGDAVSITLAELLANAAAISEREAFEGERNQEGAR